jgi:hypothetical protein
MMPEAMRSLISGDPSFHAWLGIPPTPPFAPFERPARVYLYKQNKN